jgi:four helix bundle protein
MAVKDYKDLHVWQKGIAIAEMIYKTTAGFPPSEVYGLSLQMRKSAVSISSNIAEGFTRQHTKEYKQFLYIASGSCAELETQVIIAEKIGYSLPTVSLMDHLDHELRMLKAIIRKISC